MLQTIKMSTSKFSLQWNDFETNMTDALKELREEKDFFDVTIACEDSQIQAHKVILSACSTFFRNVLRRNPHQHPLLYLKGVKYKEFIAILNFMYNGEVNVAQEELKQFLAIAGDLQVKGLTQKTGNPLQQNTLTTSTPIITKSQQTPKQTNNITEKPIPQKRESTEKVPANKRLRPSVTTTTSTKQVFTPLRTYQHIEDDEILEVVPVQPVARKSPTPATYQSLNPQKTMQDLTPPTKILEQCILEAEINNVKDHEDAPVIVREKTKKPLILTPRKGYGRIPKKAVPVAPRTMTPLTGERWQCNICLQVFLSREDIHSHLAKPHFRVEQNVNNIKM